LIELLSDAEALKRIFADDVTALTKRSTASTFYRRDLSPEQVEANRRIVLIAGETALNACGNENQMFCAAFVDDQFAGYVISTIHAPDDLELDWLMVDPAFHGRCVADVLMRAGMEWLGADRPVWLNVIQHNERAIRFYRKHGFEVDAEARTDHLVPHFIMRRKAEPKAAA
jgi:ribosomal protein S18 acetylase RimI-like enzyme